MGERLISRDGLLLSASRSPDSMIRQTSMRRLPQGAHLDGARHGPERAGAAPNPVRVPPDSNLEFVERARDALVAACNDMSERFGGAP